MDDIDRAQAREQESRDAAIWQASRPIPAGAPGECNDCGDESPRLVAGRCAPCRDARHRRAS